jgi:hypothetical protein
MEGVLNTLLSSYRMNKLISAEAALGSNTYTLTELMGDLQKNIWTELATRKPIDVYHRNLQKAFVERFSAIINPSAPASSSFGGIVISFGGGDSKKTDIISVAKGVLRSLRTEINAALPATTDKMTRYHLQDMQERIEKILNPK